MIRLASSVATRARSTGSALRGVSTFLQRYSEHVAERAALGIVPKPLDAAQAAEVVQLLEKPAEGEAEQLLELLEQRVPPGVDEAAYVKAGFLAAVTRGDAASPVVTKQHAVRLLGTMAGGYNIEPLVKLLDDDELAAEAATQLSHTILVFDAFYDVEAKARAGNGHAQKVMDSWAEAEWFTSRPEVRRRPNGTKHTPSPPLPSTFTTPPLPTLPSTHPTHPPNPPSSPSLPRPLLFGSPPCPARYKVPEKITATVFLVSGETNTDDLSPAPDAWSRPDIPLHALAMLKIPRDGIHDAQAQIAECTAKGHPVAYVGDVVGTGSSRKSATNSVLWYMGDDIPYVPNKRSGGLCIGGKIAPIFFNTMEDAGAQRTLPATPKPLPPAER